MHRLAGRKVGLLSTSFVTARKELSQGDQILNMPFVLRACLSRLGLVHTY